MGQAIWCIEPLSCECVYCFDVYAVLMIILTYNAVYVCLLCEERDYKMYEYNDLLTFQDSELQKDEEWPNLNKTLHHFHVVIRLKVPSLLRWFMHSVYPVQFFVKLSIDFKEYVTFVSGIGINNAHVWKGQVGPRLENLKFLFPFVQMLQSGTPSHMECFYWKWMWSLPLKLTLHKGRKYKWDGKTAWQIFIFCLN